MSETCQLGAFSAISLQTFVMAERTADTMTISSSFFWRRAAFPAGIVNGGEDGVVRDEVEFPRIINGLRYHVCRRESHVVRGFRVQSVAVGYLAPNPTSVGAWLLYCRPMHFRGRFGCDTEGYPRYSLFRVYVFLISAKMLQENVIVMAGCSKTVPRLHRIYFVIATFTFFNSNLYKHRLTRSHQTFLDKASFLTLPSCSRFS